MATESDVVLRLPLMDKLTSGLQPLKKFEVAHFEKAFTDRAMSRGTLYSMEPGWINEVSMTSTADPPSASSMLCKLREDDQASSDGATRWCHSQFSGQLLWLCSGLEHLLSRVWCPAVRSFLGPVYACCRWPEGRRS